MGPAPTPTAAPPPQNSRALAPAPPLAPSSPALPGAGPGSPPPVRAPRASAWALWPLRVHSPSEIYPRRAGGTLPLPALQAPREGRCCASHGGRVPCRRDAARVSPSRGCLKPPPVYKRVSAGGGGRYAERTVAPRRESESAGHALGAPGECLQQNSRKHAQTRLGAVPFSLISPSPPHSLSPLFPEPHRRRSLPWLPGMPAPRPACRCLAPSLPGLAFPFALPSLCVCVSVSLGTSPLFSLSFIFLL